MGQKWADRKGQIRDGEEEVQQVGEEKGRNDT